MSTFGPRVAMVAAKNWSWPTAGAEAEGLGVGVTVGAGMAAEDGRGAVRGE